MSSFVEPIAGGGGISSITLNGDVSGGPSTSGTVSTSVVKINGTTVPATPSANQVLVATSGSAATWEQIGNSQVASAAAIAVSKLASGTSAQVLLNNSTPAPTWTTITGDVALTNAGATTVSAIQGNTVSSGALTEGQFLIATSTSNWAPTSLSGDLSESATTPGQLSVVSITGSSGIINIASTGNILTWNSATTAPGLTQTAQASTSAGSGANGATLSIVGQGGQPATGASNNGGNGANIVIESGVGGTSGSASAGSNGTISLVCGSTTQGLLLNYGVASGGYAGMYLASLAPASNNYAFATNGSQTIVAGTTDSALAVGASLIVTANAGNVQIKQPVGGASGSNAFAWLGSTVSVAGSADVTLTSSQYNNVYISLTGSIGASINVVFPTTQGAMWFVDAQGVTFNGHTITVKCNSVQNSIAVFSTATTCFLIFYNHQIGKMFAWSGTS